MVSTETLLSYPDWNIPFNVHNDASDDQLGDFIIQSNKPIAFLFRRLRDPKRNYTTTEQGPLAIVECLRK